MNRGSEDAISTFIHRITQDLDQSPSHYAQCLFIDYSPAFATMQAHLLLDKLQQYDVHPGLQLFILNFLTNRAQYVRTEKECSPIVKKTLVVHRDVLSAILFIVY